MLKDVLVQPYKNRVAKKNQKNQIEMNNVVTGYQNLPVVEHSALSRIFSSVFKQKAFPF
ncbi:MAG: hypothetical protein ABIR66_05190 [Saprospiraceae bacterium]